MFTERIQWEEASATYKNTPLMDKQIPEGPLKRAAFPVPSVFPGVNGFPARTVATPFWDICRTMEFPKSAIKVVSPEAVTAMPRGLSKVAEIPVPGE
jgi:hypothetical protein